MKKVVDIEGNLVDSKDCRKYNDKNYVKGKHCFLMSNDKWYRIDSGKIVYDNYKGEWAFDSIFLAYGIIGFDEFNFPVFGKFSINKDVVSKVVNLTNNSAHLIMDEDIIANNKSYIKALSTDMYIFRDSNLTKKYYDTFCKKRIYNYNAENRRYNSNAYLLKSQKEYDDRFVGDNLRFEGKSIDYIYEYLNDITWGCEFETLNGKIPSRFEEKNGLIPLKDGSLRKESRPLPIEYATVVLSGKKGIKTIVKQCDLLNEYCKRGINESLHVHLGGMSPSKEYAVSMYQIALLIQDEIYDMFPKAYRLTSEFKSKDYCKPLKSLGFGSNMLENFLLLYDFLAEGEDRNFREFGDKHPRGEKWNCKSRYHLLNLNPLLFGGTKTVEWRIHNPTFNADKVMNWVYILNAISKYADKNKESISVGNIPKDLSLKSIILDAYSDSRLLTKYLFAYIAFRKRVSNEASIKGDRIGKYDLEDDSLINMKYPIKSILR